MIEDNCTVETSMLCDNVTVYKNVHLKAGCILASKVGRVSALPNINLFNSLPNNKILDQTKSEAFADDNFSVAHMIEFVLEKVENIVGKGESADYPHFPLFP